MITPEQLQALAALPLHALLLAAVVVEGFAIRTMWLTIRDMQERLDDCLGKK